jgi:hypothetical protein
MPVSFRDINLLVLGVFLAFWMQFFYDYSTAVKGNVSALVQGAEVTMMLFAGAWLVVNVLYLASAPKIQVPE